MDDYIAEIDEDPAGVVIALDVRGLDAPSGKVAIDGVDESAQVALVLGRCDDKVVCEGCDITDVEEDNIFGLTLCQKIDDLADRFVGTRRGFRHSVDLSRQFQGGPGRNASTIMEA